MFRRAASRLFVSRVDAALFILAVVLLGPIVAPNNAQPASRLDLTAALAEHGSVDITRYPKGADYSTYHGIRSDKAPGQPILAVPAYAVERVAGAESAEHRRGGGNLTLWWVTLWSATIPFAVLLVLMRRTAARAAPSAALPATVAVGFGSLLMPYAVNLYAHVLAGALGFGAWSVLSRPSPSSRRVLAAGCLAGAAVFVEYQAAAIALVLLGFVLIRERRATGWFLLGIVPGAAALGAYHWIAFGSPWRLAYSTYVNALPPGRGELRSPFGHVGELVWSPSRGLLLVSPIVLLAVAAAIAVLRSSRRVERDAAIVALAIFVLYVVGVASSRRTTVSEFPGPRFLVASLPFLVVPLAVLWDRIRLGALVIALAGGTVMAGATFFTLLVGANEPLLHAYRLRLRARQFLPTVWSIGAGRAAPFLWGITALAAVGLLLWSSRTTPKTA